MSVTAFGFSEILLMVAMMGLPANDAASLLSPADYLKAHGIEVKADQLVGLVAKEAKGPKEQITQLLAIRWLGAHAAEAKKADGTHHWKRGEPSLEDVFILLMDQSRDNFQ